MNIIPQLNQMSILSFGGIYMEIDREKILSILSKRIKRSRENKGLTQPELAKLINSTDRNISNYETGYSFPSIAVLYSISIALSTSVDYLLGLTDDPNVSEENTYLNDKDMQLITKLKSDEEIYTYLTSDADTGVYYIYETLKLMKKWKDEHK